MNNIHMYGDSKEAIAHWLGGMVNLQRVPTSCQRLGIDFIGYDRNDLKTVLTFEIKLDVHGHRTKNAFIEIGLAHSSQTFILYFLPMSRMIYVLEPISIRQQIDRWSKTYPSVIRNGDLNTQGILVPLSEIEAIANETSLI